MPRDRVISAEAQALDDQMLGPALRPRSLDEYVGQRDLVEKLSIALDAARERNDPLEHVLLHGPPGLGKTSLAHVIAAELGSRPHVQSGPALTRASDLVGMLTKLQPHDVLFIDEIHRLPPAVEEYIYPAMEDFRIDFTVDSGMHAKVIPLELQPFTLIGATTRAGALTGALRSRFGIVHNLRFYDEAELFAILTRAVDLLRVPRVEDDSLRVLALRSRGTPRIALRLLRRVRDYAQVRGDGVIDEGVLGEALALEKVDELGLDELDRAYLRTIGSVYEGGPVGVEALAATLDEDTQTLEDMVEPYLLRIGFLARTRQGRRLTPASVDHLGLSIELRDEDDGLFG